MPLDLDNVSQADLEAAILEALTVLSEYRPDYDFREGSLLGQLVADPISLFVALAQADLDRLREVWSLQYVSKDPSKYAEEDIDALLANYNLVRREGEKATGKIRVVLSSALTTQIPATTEFTHDGLVFRPTGDFLGLPNELAVSNDFDRLIESEGGGKFGFTIDVEAVDFGTAYQVRRGSAFSASPAVALMVTAYAVEDFSGGLEAESNAELIARLGAGIAARSVADRVSIEAVCRELIPGLQAVSCIGGGDSEQVRGRNNLFGISSPGYVDVYARTALAPTTKTLTLAATRVTGDTWRIVIDKAVFPGFYKVASVIQAESGSLGSLPIVSDVRLFDTSSFSGVLPDVTSGAEAAFTPFQKAILDVTVPGVTSGDVTLSVTLLGFSGLDTLQNDLFSKRSRTDPAGDYLVRAPTPCFVSVGVRIESESPDEVDTAAVKTAVANAVNNSGFSRPLEASLVVDAVYGVLGGSDRVQLPLDLRATLLKPDLTNTLSASPNRITIEDDTDLGVSRRTTAFIMLPDDVAVEVVSV